MKILSKATKENWLSTINCLISSPLVHRFNIGITVNPDQRKKTYKYFTPSWPHFLILQCGLTVELALKAEKFLKDELTKDKRSISYKKYRNDTRDGNHVPSTGGLKEGREYFLYVSWGTLASYGEE